MRIVQISAGRGPLECSWVVGKVCKKLIKEAKQIALSVSIVSEEQDQKRDCYKSIVLSLSGANEEFLNNWIGTIQWIAQSPFRPKHKRKNWFVSINELPIVEEHQFNPQEITIDTMRSSGAGGQHVNKTESAVRITHLPTGVSVTISSERSQFRNKSIAMAVLKQRLNSIHEKRGKSIEQANWQNHNELIRGNPVKVFK